MTTNIIDSPEITGIGTYLITVEVKDASNNVTSQVCELNISRVVKEYTLELGEKLEKKDVLLNIEESINNSKENLNRIKQNIEQNREKIENIKKENINKKIELEKIKANKGLWEEKLN